MKQQLLVFVYLVERVVGAGGELLDGEAQFDPRVVVVGQRAVKVSGELTGVNALAEGAHRHQASLWGTSTIIIF